MSSPLIYGGQKIRREPYRPPRERAPDVSTGLLALGSAIGRQSDALTALTVDFERSRGDIRTLEAANDLALQFRQKRYEFLNRKGTSTDGIVTESNEWMSDKVRKALENDKLNWRDRRNLSRAMAGYMRGELEILAKHQADQMALAGEVQKELMLEKYVEQISADAQNPTVMEDTLPRIDALLRKDLSPGEQPNELTQKQIRDWGYTAHAARVGGLIDIGTEASLTQAKYFLQQYTSDPEAPKIPAKVARALRSRMAEQKRVLDHDTLVANSQAAADDIMESYELGELDEAGAKDRARQLSGDLRDMTLKRVSLRIADLRASRENAYTDLRRSVYDNLVDLIPPGAATIPKMTNETESAVEAAISRLRPEDQDQARSYATHLIYGDIPTAATDAALVEYRQLNADELLNMHPTRLEKKFRHRMTDADWKVVSAEHRQILLGNMTAATWHQRKSGFLSEIGLVGTKEKQRAAVLSRILDREYERRSGEKGAPLSGEQMDALIGDFTITGVEPDGGWFWFDREVPYWQALLEAEENPNAEWERPELTDIIGGHPTLLMWWQDWRDRFITKNGRDPNALETQNWLNETSAKLDLQVRQ